MTPLSDLTVRALYPNAGHSLADSYLSQFTYPWEALDGLKDFILALAKTLPKDAYEEVTPGVFVAKSAKIAPSATIAAPTIIGPDTEVRPSAFIRGSALVGAGCVIGNSTELKNCIIFDSVQVPHFNYVGDSILGFRSHMGAGSVTSNVKSDKTNVTVKVGEDRLETGRRKFGAMLGDFVEIGCNSVLNPGTVIGPYSNIYPLTSVRGFIPTRSIVKSGNFTVVSKRED